MGRGPENPLTDTPSPWNTQEHSGKQDKGNKGALFGVTRAMSSAVDMPVDMPVDMLGYLHHFWCGLDVTTIHEKLDVVGELDCVGETLWRI